MAPRPFPALWPHTARVLPDALQSDGGWSWRTSRISKSSLAFPVKNVSFIFKTIFARSTKLTPLHHQQNGGKGKL